MKPFKQLSSKKQMTIGAALFAAMVFGSPVHAVPSGAIVAFDLEDCPNGWSSYGRAKGRMIIGAGIGKDLTPRKLGATGGREKVKLKIEHLPPHQHLAPFGAQPGQAHYGQGGVKSVVLGKTHGNHQVTKTSSVGSGKKLTNVPPFIALRYCKKD